VPSQTQETTSPEGEAPVPTPETKGQVPLPPQPMQPFFVPQFPAQYPPAFQQPFGAPTIGPGAPGGGPLQSPWTPPVAPPPSQTRDPGALPPAFQTALSGGKLFDLRPTLGLSESWTDNFNRTVRNRQQDFRTQLSPGLRLLINGASTQGMAMGNAGLTYDTADRSNEIKVFPSASVAIQQTLGPRLSLSLLDTYTRTDQGSQGDVFGLRTQRQTFQTNSFALSANYLIDQIRTRGFYQNTIFFSGGTDTISHVLGANASSPFGTVNTATVGYQFTESETSQSGSGSGSGSSTGHTLSGSVARQTGQFSSAGLSSSYTVLSGGDTTIWNVSLFTTYGLPSGLSMSGSIGYSLLSPKNGQDTSAITSNSSLSYRFTKATIAIGVFQDFRQTALEGQDFGIVETRGYTGTFLYTFTPFITGSLQATYTTNDNTGIGNSSSNSPTSSNLSATAGINWRLLRWLVMNVQYTYSLRSTTGGSSSGTSSGSSNGDIVENRAILQFFASF
jgi:hypothetical protein